MSSRLLSHLPFRPLPQVLPRLTDQRTAQVIAQETGQDPSKILARLDAARKKRLQKSGARAGRNAFGTLEYAVDYAVARLGVKRVAEILSVNEWSLRKGIDPNQPERRLPDFGWSKLTKLVLALKREGHTEYFSAALDQTGDTAAALEHLPTVHHALTLSAATHGDMARTLIEATDKDGPGGEAITKAEAAAILDAIARHQEALVLLQSHVMTTSKVREGAS